MTKQHIMLFLGGGGGGGRGEGCSILGIIDLPPPILNFSHFFQFKLFKISSLRGDNT